MTLPADEKEHPLLTAEEEEEEDNEGVVPERRLATLYDAVAGRVTKDNFVQKKARLPNRVIRHSVRGGPLGPDEALFRRKDAPQRYAEHDVYYAHDRDLPRGGRGVLPESDLLKCIHAYSSRFYAATERRQRRTSPSRPGHGGCGVDERSMDETALLAFGILLEEAGRDILGRKGDCVFTEGVVEGEDARSTADGQEAVRRASLATLNQRAESISSHDERAVKRRRGSTEESLL